MKNIITFLLILIVFLTGVFIYAAVMEDEHLVVRVIDGDTFVLRNGDTIRIIGIDSPEKGRYYYEESKARLAELIHNKSVALASGIANKDKYGRLLRYVYFDRTFINLQMVEEGFARASPYEPNVRYDELFKTAENTAKEKQTGIWAEGLTENPDCTFLGCETGSNYAGSINSNKYHRCESRFARMIAKENIICFKTEQEAEDAGYIKSE